MQPVPTPKLKLARRAFSAAALAGCVVVVLSACGSSGSPANASASSGGTSTSSSSRYQSRLKFAECMRAHGVNVPDPSANGAIGGGGGAAGGPGAGPGEAFQQAQSNPNFKIATTACAKYRAQAFQFRNITPAQRAQFQAQLVNFAKCMRAHNINVPDPSTTGSGGFGFRKAFGSVDRNSPAFQSAMNACASNLPFRKGFGGGAPTVGGPGA